MDLSVRAYHCLMRNDLHTLQDIIKFANGDVLNILKIRNLGKKSLVELIEKLGEYNVKFFKWETREDICDYLYKR